MDSLKELWKIQKSFNVKVIDFKNITDKERCKLTEEYILSCIKELVEVADEVSYKTYKETKPINKANIKEELIDVQKFLICLFQIWDIEPEEFVAEFKRKSKVVELRYEKIAPMKTPR